MSAEQQLARARTALRAGDRVRARQLLGSLLRQDPTMVEGWVLLSRTMSTRAASEWCLQCAANFIPIDDADPSSTPAHPESAEGDAVPSGQVEPARPARDDQSAALGPRRPPGPERPRQTSHRLTEAWQALDSTHFAEDSELASISRTLEARRQETRRNTGAAQARATERDRPPSGGGTHEAGLSAPETCKGDTGRRPTQDETPGANDRETPALVPRAERREKRTDDRPAKGAPSLQASSTAWRAVYLEPARGFLEEEEREAHGPSPTDRELGGALARLSGLAVRALRTLRQKLTRAERCARSVAQLLLFGFGVLLLCNGASLLYPRVVPSLRRNPGLAEAAPALGAQGEAEPLNFTIAQEATPSTPKTSPSRSLHHDADPLTAQTTVPTSAGAGQSVSPTPVPKELDALQASLASSDLPETRSKPGLTVSRAFPSRLVIPTLALDAPVVPVTSTTREIQGRQVRSWNVPGDGAAGWHTESAPLGVVGNTVLNGHNTTEGEVFRDLYQLQPGDEVILFADDEQHTYTVATTAVFREAGAPLERRLEHAQLLGATEDKRLTLITCHPYGSTVNRLVVTCLPQEDPTARGRLKE